MEQRAESHAYTGPLIPDPIPKVYAQNTPPKRNIERQDIPSIIDNHGDVAQDNPHNWRGQHRQFCH